MEWREKTIKELYQGDVKRFENDYAQAVDEGCQYAVNWNNLVLGSSTLPELEEAAQQLIERRLGYMPHQSVTLRFEPYIRALIQSHRQGSLTDDQFTQQAEEHIKLIRNEDMEDNSCLSYEESIYINYEQNYHIYRHAVKERLQKFMGYQPELKHSIVAQMWLHEIMADDSFQLPDHITQVDIKAITLIRYRQVLLTEGKAAADASPLSGMGGILE